MTHDIRLIALDLDGTLLNEKGLLTSRSARALTCAHEQGIFIAAATGRAFCALPTDVRALPAISYIITSNGTGIYQMPEEKRIYTNAMSRENLEQLLPLLDTFSCPIEAYIDGTALCLCGLRGKSGGLSPAAPLLRLRAGHPSPLPGHGAADPQQFCSGRRNQCRADSPRSESRSAGSSRKDS